MLKAKEILLADGVTYAPAVVSVNLDGTVNSGNVTMGNVTLNVSTLATAVEQSNQTVLLTAIRDNTANITGGGSTNITTLATLAEQQKQTGNLTTIATQTVGLATRQEQGNQTTILQTIANQTANNTVTVTNLTTLATATKQDQLITNLSAVANYTAGVANATHQVNQTTLLNNLTIAAANQTVTQSLLLTSVQAQTASYGIDVTASIDLTTLNAVSPWWDLVSPTVKNLSKFELVLVLGTAATVPVLAFEMDYSPDGSAIVQVTQTLTGSASKGVALGGIEGRPMRVRCKVVTAGVTLGSGSKVLIVGSW